MANYPTRGGVEAAPALTFDKPLATVPIVVKARLNGWPVEIELDIAPSRLGAALAKLAELGYAPDAPVTAPAAPRQAKRQTVEPEYDGDGTPCCPVHHKPLREGSYGLHCTSKDPTGRNGYCDLKFN
jgi:hypothetical protein